jgi:hypothetical protein
MNIKIKSVFYFMALLWGINSSAFAQNGACFFRVVSTQQTHIVQFDAPSGKIGWANDGQVTIGTVEMKSSLSDSWVPVFTSDSSTVSTGLTVVTIPNMVATDVPFSKLYLQHTPSFVNIRTNVVIRSESEWSSLCKTPIPNIDFTSEMVVAVTMGWQSSGGYSTTIKEIHRQCGKLFIYYEERYPAPGDIVTLAITMPSCFVKVPLSDADAIFKGTRHQRNIQLF